MIRAIAAGTAIIGVLLGGGTSLAGAALDAPSSGAPFVRPVQGAWVSLEFGCTALTFESADPACPGGHWHSGIDLAAGRGTPVRAMLSGLANVVASATGYGLHVIIDHGNGLSSLYAHLDSVAIVDSSWVDAGEVIGTLGFTGDATGPHLHFEVRRDGIPEDPRNDMSLP